jgi:hypothetical protein
MPPVPDSFLLVEDTLDRVIDLALIEVPFAANVAQLARQAECPLERLASLDSLYRIALEHEAPYLGELVDIVLTQLEVADVAS